MNLHVLVPAAGSGKRFGGTLSKQYLELGERPILVQTLLRLAAVPAVAKIHVIVPEAEAAYCRDEIIARYQLPKIAGVVIGGAERQDSVRNGLAACGAAAQDIVLIHDAVRPFFPAEQLPELATAAAKTGAAVLAVPAQDTIKQVKNGLVTQTLERSSLWQVQTPQAFQFKRLSEAHGRARDAGYTGTDDASLIEWCGWPVAVVTGSNYNFKITQPADLALAKALLAAGEVTLA